MKMAKVAVQRLLAVAVLAALARASLGGTLGFDEEFALAPDRNVPLKQLIPGTPDYYYYKCLQYQNTADFAQADAMLQQWIARDPGRGDARIREMENRQALLTYDQNQKKTLDFLQQRLGLSFSHERETLDQQRALPTSLDNGLITWESLRARAFSSNPNDLSQLENSALNWLDPSSLNPQQLHEFLSRLERPDMPGLVDLVNKDLNSNYTGGQFTLPIHRQMLLSQLDDLLKVRPGILNDTNYVNAYMVRLRPANGVDWKHDPKEEQAYLDRLWAFVSKLGQTHNSLKANVLYQRLVFDRTQNVWDKDRFLEYVKLPKNSGIMRPQYMTQQRGQYQANLGEDYSASIVYRPIGSDDELVRSYLLHFFVDADDISAYSEYIENTYLSGALAEAKITNGVGDQEKWFAMAQNLQALRDRVDIEFAYTNKQFYKPEDPVALDVYVKNVKTLMVKVYDINTPGYYKANLRELGTDMPLDGLVANDDMSLAYDEPAVRRVARHFEFPKLDKRGAYMIEFIGNGISSRALVIKGKLHFIEDAGSAGHVFTVLDEKNAKVPDASLWMAGHEYKADAKDGLIVVPYSTAPGRQAIILQEGDFASLDQFTHEAENYSFNAAFHVDREELIRGGKATVLIRPMLYVNNQPVSLRLLDDKTVRKTTLVITSVDREGTPTSKEIPDFPLLLDRETTYDFVVPDNLSSVSFAIRGQVKNLSQNKTIDVVAGRTFAVNQVDATNKIEDLFLSHVALPNGGTGYMVDVLGKTGEPLPERPVHVSLKHKDFVRPVDVELKSDAKGRVTLGTLEGIASFTATTADGVSHTWTPMKDQHSPVTTAHARVGDAITLPFMGTKAGAADVSLLELRDGVFHADWLKAVKLKDGLLTIDDLPAGDYSLRYKETGETVSIRIVPGIVRDGWILGSSRFLEQRDPNPLQISSVTADADNVTIKLVNTTKLTRVHVVASRYEPEFRLYASLSGLPMPQDGGLTLPILDAQYVAGRNIGDEYRYILDRKYASIFPGNTLARPGLLLNPWSIRKTETGKQTAAAGQAPMGQPGQGMAGGISDGPVQLQMQSGSAAFSSVDFLPSMSVVMANLLPDEKGEIVISRKLLGDHQEVQVVAVDLGATVGRELTLPETALAARDLRLKTALDVAKHFTEQKQIVVVQKGGEYSSDDAASSALEAYDSVAKVYKLYATLSKDPTLAEFSFIVEWPKLTKEQKQEKYSKYACHELNFFLSKKDPGFFEAVILPYLKNKKDKTFMDHYLLKDDLSVYLKPSEYDRLNTAEQALLGERIATEQPAAARHIKDRYDLQPTDTERFNYLFRTALQGGVLDMTNLSGQLALSGQNTFNGGIVVNGGTLGIGGTIDGSFTTSGGGGVGGLGGVGGFGGGGGRGGGGGAGGGRGGRGGAGAPGGAPAAASPPATRAPAAPGDFEGAKKDELASLADKSSDQLTANEAMASDLDRRHAIQQLYLKLDKTEEWAENNYYHVLIEKQDASLIQVNSFWRDYAQAAGKPGFLSTNLAEASHSFPEMMVALGVLDLPFESPKLDVAHKDGKLSFTAPGPMVVFHRETNEAPADPAKTPILVSQNFFRESDRYTYVDNEKSDKYVSDEFLTHVVYGCQVVVTNPTSSRQKLDVLLQVPQGALPVNNGLYTRGIHADLNPFESRAIEYYFYFPTAGNFAHYPVHVARNEKVIAFAPAVAMKVVDTPSKVDTASWDYISQNGTPEQVTQYLKDNNIDRLNLEKIAWRMKDADYFKSVTDLLASRHVYNDTLWSYSIKNNNVPAMREFLQKTDSIANNVGAYIDSKLLTLDPVERRSYQFLEYSPLINARIHKMGRDRQIVNDRFYEQYERLMALERYRPAMDQDDLMTVTYYLLLQDRVDEAMKFMARVDASKLTTQLQYDYFRTYMAFYTESPKEARAIVDKYKDYPVDRWRQLFTEAGVQLDELEGKAGAGGTIVKPDDRNQQQGALAANAPNLDFKVESRKVTMTYQNIAEAHVNYYLMDIELMFSQNPFLGKFNGQFTSIKPNDFAVLKLDPAKKTTTFDLPERFANSNVMVEITAGGVTRTQAYYPNSLAVQFVENYGQLQVTSEKTGEALQKVYVKVYARLRNGQIEFYKDGYTDLRGKFEYASLSTNDLDNVDRFSVLVLSEKEGAVVREAAPPKQ